MWRCWPIDLIWALLSNNLEPVRNWKKTRKENLEMKININEQNIFTKWTINSNDIKLLITINETCPVDTRRTSTLKRRRLSTGKTTRKNCWILSNTSELVAYPSTLFTKNFPKNVWIVGRVQGIRKAETKDIKTTVLILFIPSRRPIPILSVLSVINYLEGTKIWRAQVHQSFSHFFNISVLLVAIFFY